MKSKSNELLDKSISAMIAAIEVYNKPDFLYRGETFSILAINSWELLLKAKYLKDNHNKMRSLYVMEPVINKDGSKSKKKKVKLTRSGNPFTHSIDFIAKKLIEKGEMDQIVFNNIMALIELRDSAIQLVRYAYKKTDKLKSLLKGYSQRFTLYCGQAQRPLSPDQQEIMKAIADYIINEGSISVTELNSIDTDLWRKAVKSFGIPALTAEMIDLSKFILKAA